VTEPDHDKTADESAAAAEPAAVDEPAAADESGEAGDQPAESAGTPEPEAAPLPVGWLPHDAVTLFGAGAHAAEAYGLLTVDLPAESWIPALETARDELGCSFFDWLSAVDEPGSGFLVCAHVVALPTAGGGAVRRLLLRTTVPHEAPVLPTATGVFAGAAWHERETHEMFGVDFTGHPHLVPLLLPDTFEGHPLRKDFVLAARVAKAWPGAVEPGESGAGRPKRRQMLPPGVPDPNEWGPLKGQLPPVPSRPARGRAAAAGRGGAAEGERPVRRTRSAAAGSASQQNDDAAQEPEQAPKPEQGREPEQAPEPAPAPEQQPPGTPASEAPWHDAPPAPGNRDGTPDRDADGGSDDGEPTGSGA
jgi:NADH:ubiquinone oxidoreductase subunit C